MVYVLEIKRSERKVEVVGLKKVKFCLGIDVFNVKCSAAESTLKRI